MTYLEVGGGIDHAGTLSEDRHGRDVVNDGWLLILRQLLDDRLDC